MKNVSVFLLLLFLIPIASASTVTRTFSISEVYFNSTTGLIPTHKQYNITLSPSPLIDFDLPGYYVTEYLPLEFKFINTNADKYTLVGNKLELLKFLPTSSNSTLKYTLQYKKDINPISSFYGTYLDENRNYGIITQENTSSSSSSGSTSIVDSTPSVTYVKSKKIIMATPTYTSEFIPLPASQVQVMPYTQTNNFIGTILCLLMVVGVFIILFIISRYHKKYHIKLLSSGDIIIDKEPIGVTETIKFVQNTEYPLVVKIIGDISKVVTSIKEVPCDMRCFEISIKPDGKDHDGFVAFMKKNVKTIKYRINKS